VRELERQLDSLQRLAHALETDPAAQERAAREQFGMIRKGELLYRLVPKVEAGDGTPHPPRGDCGLASSHHDGQADGFQRFAAARAYRRVIQPIGKTQPERPLRRSIHTPPRLPAPGRRRPAD